MTKDSLSILVIAATENRVEAINSTLRNAGVLARCDWAGSLKDADERLTKHKPDLIIAFTRTPREELQKVINLRDKRQPDTPVLAADTRADEEKISAAMASGARDMISLSQLERMQQVIRREVEASRIRAEHATFRSENAAMRERLGSLVEESQHAIAMVSEGIVVDANPAFGEMFGLADEDEAIGTPLMDHFGSGSQMILKGALKACMKGKWGGDLLEVEAVDAAGEPFEVVLELDESEFEDEPCLQASFTRPQTEEQAEAEAAVGDLDPVTETFARPRFAEFAEERIAATSDKASLCIMQLDGYDKLRGDIGPFKADEVMTQLAALVREAAGADDILGRYGDSSLVVVATRGAHDQFKAVVDSLVETVRGHLFEAGGKSLPMSLSAGIAQMQTREPVDILVQKAEEALTQAVEAGGDRAIIYEPPETDEEGKLTDDAWGKRLREAIKANRFRLVFQSIANLQGEGSDMHDVLVRMVGEEDEEIMPGEFIPAAIRTGLMSAVDRWVIAASLKHMMKHESAILFVRLSQISVGDAKLAEWLKGALAKTGIKPERLVVQIAERTAEESLREAKARAEELSELGCQIALEHFGVGNNSRQTLSHLDVDYVKVDGSLMSGITRDTRLQERVRSLIEMAKEKKDLPTVAERVEDANTMAVLWQLGIDYLQGHYVQEPEVVIAES